MVVSSSRSSAVSADRGVRRRPAAAGTRRCPPAPVAAVRSGSSSTRERRRSCGSRSRTTSRAADPVGVRAAGRRSGRVERMLEVQAIIARTYAVAHLGRHAARRLRPVLDDALSALPAGAAEDVAAGRRSPTRRPRHTAGMVLWYDGARRARSSTPTAAATPAPRRTSGAGPARPYLRPRPTTARRSRAHASGDTRSTPAALHRGAERRSAHARRQGAPSTSTSRSATRRAARSLRLARRHARRHGPRRGFARRCSARLRRESVRSTRFEVVAARRRGSSSPARASATASASARPAPTRGSRRARAASGAAHYYPGTRPRASCADAPLTRYVIA